MPLFPYACKCGHEEERAVEVARRDRIRPKCPNCGRRLKRQMTAASLHGDVFQMQAVMADGSRVKGRFGREDNLLRRK